MPKKLKPRSKALPAARLRRAPPPGFLFDTETGAVRKPPRLPARPVNPAEAEAYKARRQSERIARAERLEVRRQMERRRPAEMRAPAFRLPAGVEHFLRGRVDRHRPFVAPWEMPVGAERLGELIEEAFLAGCREGFIEGFLYGEEKARPGAIRSRDRLRRMNEEKLARLGIADRNAEIVARFGELEAEMPGVGERHEHLADVHNLTPRQIANILRDSRKKPRR